MENPWRQMPLFIYEAHMGLPNVEQLQALNKIMKKQWAACPGTASAAIIGIAGGNGLEHCRDTCEIVYGIDVNTEYLQACARRFQPGFGKRLQLIEADVAADSTHLPQAELLMANLVIEYIGTEIFCKKAAESQAKYISCVIQINVKNTFVSDSPYQTEFEEIGQFHHDVSEDELTTAFQAYGYQQVVREVTDLPNGKQFVRLDYSLETCPAAGGNGQTHTGGPPPGAGRRPGRGRIIQNEYFV